MSDNLRMYTRALYEFDHVVRRVPDSTWDNSTPCPDWSVRDVVGHVIAVQRYIESLVEGTDVPMNPYNEPGRYAGKDPAATWRAARDAALGALDGPGVISRRVRTFRAEETIDSQIGWNVVDTVAHAWDVAQGAGMALTLSEDLVEHAIVQAAPMVDNFRRPPFFAAATVESDADDSSARLLRMLGREPDVGPSLQA